MKETRIDLPINRIIKMYEHGVSIQEIARQYFVHSCTIKSRLIEAGVYKVKKQTHRTWMA